jgi:hypothetical protein
MTAYYNWNKAERDKEMERERIRKRLKELSSKEALENANEVRDFLKFTSPLNRFNECNFLRLDMDRKPIKESSLYFGTGLASFSKPSLGFGIDFLCTIFCALNIKRQLGLKKVIHEISTVGYNITDNERDELVAVQKEQIERLVTNLGITGEYQLNFSNEYHEDVCFNEILSEAREKLNVLAENPNYKNTGNYLTLQIAGMKYLYDKQDVRFKLGWTINKIAPPKRVERKDAERLISEGKLSEYFFDQIYRFAFPQDKYSFVYTPPALDPITGGRSAPYTVTEDSNKPLLFGEDIMSFMSRIPFSKEKTFSKENYTRNIVDLYSKLFGDGELIDYAREKEFENLSKIQARVMRPILNIERGAI